MPILTTLRALLGSWLSRIGGWLLLAGAALAWLWARDRGNRQAGRAEAEAKVVADNAAVRAEQLKVERPKDYEDLTARLRGKK